LRRVQSSISLTSDIWHLDYAGKSSKRDRTAWDLIRPYLEQERLQLIGEMTPDQLLAISRTPGFSTLFESVSVLPLTSQQILEIAEDEAKRLKLETTERTVTRAFELCQQFLPAVEGPGPVLQLLAQIRDYQSQKRDVNEPEELSPQFVEKVFSIYSGLPRIVVSPSVTKPVSEVEAWFEEHIVGQKEAIRAVVETIALYKAGLHDPARPIGSFLFVGPTGVGKTELARALARYLFGSENRLLRFDLSEYKDFHAFQLLIGDPNNPDRPARLVDPVRAKPFQVVLLDEIEKAHANVWDLLLQLLDEGRLTPASGKTVSFRNTIVIATTNVGAREQARSSPGFTSGGSTAGDDRMRAALEASFRPEFLNRFQHLCLFHPLTEEHVRQIARMELRKVLARQGVAGRKIAVDVTPSVMDLVVTEGYDEKYGARALRRMIQRHVTVPVATLLLEKAVDDGSILRLVADRNSVRVDVIDTPETRSQKAQAKPIRTPMGKVSTKQEMASLLKGLKSSRQELVRSFDLKTIAADSETPLDCTDTRENTDTLIRLARQREATLSSSRRLDRLLEQEVEFETWLTRAVTREERQRLLNAVLRYEAELQAVRRELILMPEASISDALVELKPLTSNNSDALELFNVYASWAKQRGYSVDLVCEPMAIHEPVIAAVGGHYAYGHLHLESGHHRFRGEKRNSVIRVCVLPWKDATAEVSYSAQRALKKVGLLGGRVRSRLQVAGSDLFIQNDRTLAENRSVAGSVVASYLDQKRDDETEVRRYDSDPFLLKDHLTGSTGRADVLSPDKFHDLLCRRVETTYMPSDTD
jgi:flagellar biosynthesis GTPase FlhF